MTHLAACPGCARHVRLTESTCPFCRAALPATFREARLPARPAVRLSRAVLYALGVGTISVTSTACGGRVGGERGESDGGAGDATSMAEAGPFTIDSDLVEEAPINYAVPYGLPPMHPPPDEDGR
jgi:hypothetical protein